MAQKIFQAAVSFFSDDKVQVLLIDLMMFSISNLAL